MHRWCWREVGHAWMYRFGYKKVATAWPRDAARLRGKEYIIMATESWPLGRCRPLHCAGVQHAWPAN